MLSATGQPKCIVRKGKKQCQETKLVVVAFCMESYMAFYAALSDRLGMTVPSAQAALSEHCEPLMCISCALGLSKHSGVISFMPVGQVADQCFRLRQPCACKDQVRIHWCWLCIKHLLPFCRPSLAHPGSFSGMHMFTHYLSTCVRNSCSSGTKSFLLLC